MYSRALIMQLTEGLLTGLHINQPTEEQRLAVESFILGVILPNKDRAIKLSPKQQLCLQLAACGYTAKETAAKLSLSPGTIKNYREKILEKLECKSIAQAVFKVFG